MIIDMKFIEDNEAYIARNISFQRCLYYKCYFIAFVNVFVTPVVIRHY